MLSESPGSHEVHQHGVVSLPECYRSFEHWQFQGGRFALLLIWCFAPACLVLVFVAFGHLEELEVKLTATDEVFFEEQRRSKGGEGDLAYY